MAIMHIAPHFSEGFERGRALCPKAAPWPEDFGKYPFSSMSYCRDMGAAGASLPELIRAKGN
jgi:hypothetical protein